MNSNNPGPLPGLADVAPTQRPVQHTLPRLADVAPRERPNQHRQPAGRYPYDYGHLQQSLDSAHRKIGEWNQWYEAVEPMLYNVNGVETAYGYRIRSTATIRKLQEELVNKKWESAEQFKKWDIEISSLVKSRDDWKKKVKQLEEQLSQKDSEIQTFKEHLTKKDAEISILKESLQKKTEEANNIENFQKEECITMAARWEVEKAILSASSQLKQDESLQKMKQLEEQLSQKNAEILTLKNEELSKRDSEISFLKESLQKKSEEADKMECLWKEQCSYMTATWEAEKASLLSSSKEMLQIQDESLKKMKQLEERFSQRGAQILELRENISKTESETSSLQIQKQYEELWDELAKKEESWKVTIKQLKDEKDILNDVLWMNKEDLTKMEMEFSNLLTTKEAELCQTEKTWQTKYDALEAQRAKELAEKEQSWEDRVRQMEEEKNTLQELYSKKVEKRGRRFWSHKKKVKSQTQLEEAGETEKKKEKKQKEKEGKKTGFRSWLHKKDSNSKVEEAADCSVQAGQ